MPQKINFSPRMCVQRIDETIHYVKNKNILFIDGSICDLDSFLTKTNEYKFFGEYNPAELEKIVSWTSQLIKVSNLDNAISTKNICNEIKGLEDKLNYRLTHTSICSAKKNKSPRNKHERYKKNNEDKAAQNKQLYEHLQQNVHEFYSGLLKKSPYLAKEEKQLAAILHKISSIRKLKEKHHTLKDSLYQEQQYNKCKDEELVARAYHHLVNGEKDLVIITKDTDIERLTIAMYELFETKFYSRVPIVAQHILKNPISLINTDKLRITNNYGTYIKNKVSLHKPSEKEIRTLHEELYKDKHVIKDYLRKY
jgi:hypothetical protein